MKLQALAVAALLMSAGCATVNLVSASKPHAVLVLDVRHGAEHDGMFDDVVVIDGLDYPIGQGEGGELTVRLPPGKHAVSLVSFRQEQRLQVSDVQSRAKAPYMVGPNSLYIPDQRIEPVMQLGLAPVSACRHKLDLDARAGQTIRAGLRYDAKGMCRPEGA